MRARRTVCLRRLGRDHAGETRFGRFLANRRVTPDEMLATAAGHCRERAVGRHVLAIQDTSEINFQAHARRVRGLGPVGNGTDLGFFIHPALAVDAASGGIIGLAGGRIWTRDGKITSGRRERCLADKESRRWIDTASDSFETLGPADMVTSVADREGDIYEMFAAKRPANAHLLVRAAQDRCLADGQHVFAAAAVLAEQHRYQIEVPAKALQKKRTATVAVGFGRVEIKRPARASRGTLPDSVTLTLVVVREIDPPADIEPVRWVLLTTHVVESLDAALEIVRFYRLRWHIEQLFRTLKTHGMNVEESQVVDGHALINLVTVALIAAMQALQVTLARDGRTSQPASDAFAPDEVCVLTAVSREFEGRTAKQSNPHGPGSLAWAAWIIGRLGGWNGYASQKPPGPKTMHIGLATFQTLTHGWHLCDKDVCMP
jgi:hypothetical protein